MRYWAFFLGKLITVAALSQGFYLGISHLLPAQEAMRLLPAQDSLAYQYPPRFAHDLWFTAGIGVWFLLTCGTGLCSHLGPALPLPRLPAPAANAN